MRLAIRGRNETVELRLIDDQWLSDEGDPIEFEAILTEGNSALVKQLASALRTPLRALGGFAG